MIYKVKIKDYTLLHGEGHAHIVIDGRISHVFIPFGNLYSTLNQKNYRERELEVDVCIVAGYVRKVEIKRKMIIELTEKETLAPDYLFMGEVIEKKTNKTNDETILLDCGILIDFRLDKKRAIKFKKGDFLLVIGRLDANISKI